MTHDPLIKEGFTIKKVGFYISILLMFIFSASSITFASTGDGHYTVTIKDVSDLPDPFSPNGDGVKDSINLSANVEVNLKSKKAKYLYIEWHWKIINPLDSSEVYSFSGLDQLPVIKVHEVDNIEHDDIDEIDKRIVAIPISRVWDGKDKSGAIVPDNVYNYVVSARLVKIKHKEGTEHIHGSGDNKDDDHSGMVDLIGDGNSGQGDDKHDVNILSEAAPVNGTITLDNTSPVLSVGQPLNGIIAGTNTPLISIAFTDNLSGIDKNSLKIYINDIDSTSSFTITNAGAGYQITDANPLPEGQNSIKTSVIDNAGNSASIESSFIVDTVPPAVSITAPLKGSYLNTPQITVSGNASDATTSVKTVAVNGVPASVSNGVFTANNISLTEGANTLTASAEDTAGNIGVDTAEIYLDTAPPVINIVSPAANSISNINNPQIKITYSDNLSNIDAASLRILINNVEQSQSFTITEAEANSSTIILNEGQNSITANIKDRAGNTSSANITVTVDTAPPLITDITPPNNKYLNTPAITVSGNVSDATSAITSVTVNGQTAAVAGNSFTAGNVSLTEGSNTIAIIAIDAAGNQATASVTITLDTAPPVINVSSPGNGSITNQASISVSAAITDSSPIISGLLNQSIIDIIGNAISGLFNLISGRNTITISATDAAGNTGTITVEVIQDTTPPAITITTPANGSVTTTLSTNVVGVVDDPEASIKINGADATNTNGQFNLTSLSLQVGSNTITVTAVDKAGNTGSASVAITAAPNPPVVSSITAPQSVAAGQNIFITAEARDDYGISALDIFVNNQLIGSSALSPQSISYTVPSNLTAGSTLLVKARARNIYGLTAENQAAMTVASVSLKPGFISGEVFDDTKGLPMSGANISVTPINPPSGGLYPPPVQTGADGGYIFQLMPGDALVQISKDGRTKVERKGRVLPEKESMLLDGRLTPIDKKINILGADGGTAADASGNIEMVVIPNSLSGDTNVYLTSISNQGLINRLPYGWSPIAGIDITPTDIAFSQPALIKLKNNFGLSADTDILTAFYDAEAHQWIAYANARVGSDARLIAFTISKAGQYVLLMPDSGSTAPPAQTINQALTGYNPPALPTDLSASGKVVPRASPPGEGVKATGEVKVSSALQIPSGIALEVLVSERFDIKGGEIQTPDSYNEDIIIYAYAPPSPLAGEGQGEGYVLRTTFPVTPSKSFTLQDLFLGRLELNISVKEEGAEGGAIVGQDGARLTVQDGVIIEIPQNALNANTVLKTQVSNISPIPLTDDVVLLKRIELDFSNAVLNQSANISIPIPANYVSGSQIIIAKLISINSVKRPKIAAIGNISGSLITTSRTMGGITLPGITGGGEYLILQMTRPIGFVTGRVMDTNNQPVSGAYTYTDKSIFYDLTGIDGSYITGAAAGSFTATGQKTGTPDMGTASGTMASANASVSLDITIQQSGLSVAAIIPENNSQNISVNQPVGIFFNHAINRQTINENSITINDGTANITGVLSISADNKGAAIYPSTALKGKTLYTITIKGTITDIFGRQLGSDVISRFTTTDTTPPPIPPAGSITMSFPDAEGFVTLTATQGTADPGHKVTLMNFTTGDGVSLNVNPDGSFTGRIMIENFNDDLMLIIRDQSGNISMTGAGIFKDTDGTMVIGRRGGRITGEGDTIIDIPEGAIGRPAKMKAMPVLQNDLPVPIPAGLSYLGAIKIDTDIKKLKLPLKLSMPAPANTPTNIYPFIASITDVEGTPKYTIVDNAKIINNRISTASPPFEGLISFVPQPIGTGVFAILVPTTNIEPKVIYGYTYRDVNGNNQFDSGTDLPVRNAVITIPTAIGDYVARSNNDGKYSTLIYDATGNVPPIQAKDIYTGETITISSYSIGAAASATSINIKFADIQTIDDKKGPDITLSFSGANYISGTIPVNTPLTITVKATDNSAVKTVYLYVNNVPVELTEVSSSQPSALSPSPLASSSYTGQYTPDSTGTYNINAAAWDTHGNANEKSAIINSADPATLPSSIPNSPPMVITAGLYPFDGATEINVDQTLDIPFTEPVNITINNNLYIREKGTDTQIPITSVTTELLPGIYKIKLEHNHFDFNKQYEIIITDQIRDLDNEALSNPMTISFKTKELKIDGQLDFINDQYTAINDQVINEDKNRLYLLDRWNGLRVADITNPAQPKEAGRRDITPWGRGIGVTVKSGIALRDDKNTAVIVGSNTTISQSMMWLINVATDPKDTDAVAGYSILNNWYKQSTYVPIPLVYGGYTYESTGIGNYDKDDGVPFRVAVIGTEAYVTSLFIGIQVVDLTKVFGSPNTNPVTAIIDTKQNTGTIDTLPRYIKAINKKNGIKKLIVTTTEGLITINPDTIYRAEPTTISSQKTCSSEVSCLTVRKDFFCHNPQVC